MEPRLRWGIETHIGAAAIGTIPDQHLLATAGERFGKFADARRLLREAAARRDDDGIALADDFVLDVEAIDGDLLRAAGNPVSERLVEGLGRDLGPTQKCTRDSERAQEEGFTPTERFRDRCSPLVDLFVLNIRSSRFLVEVMTVRQTSEVRVGDHSLLE